MEKLTFIISLSLISLIIVVSIFSSSPIVLAKTKVEKTSMLNQFSSHNHDPAASRHLTTYHDSPILLPLSSSGISTDLSSSFSNIINTQIFTGLNN